MNTIKKALQKHSDDLMKIPGVEGTAQGLCNGRPCIKIFVAGLTKENKDKIPDELEGYPVIFEETGMFKAL
jgi:hypothetical protein